MNLRANLVQLGLSPVVQVSKCMNYRASWAPLAYVISMPVTIITGIHLRVAGVGNPLLSKGSPMLSQRAHPRPTVAFVRLNAVPDNWLVGSYFSLY